MNLKRTNFIYGTSIFFINRDSIIEVQTVDGENLIPYKDPFSQ